MNILHIGLLSHFTEGMLYQDNILSDMNVKDGHSVTFISDTFCYENGEIIETPEEDRILQNGVRLIRLKYDRILTNFITDKIQKVKKLLPLIEELQPDTILYHGVCGYELMDVSNYVKQHPNVLFYVDSHEDFHNTARTPLAKFCYKYIHGIFIKKALSSFNKVFYLTLETKEYLQRMYSLKEEIMEYYPLGGIMISEQDQISSRQYIIDTFKLREDAIICAHSGKMVKEKRTEELLQAFESVKDDRLQMLIFGSIPKDQLSTLMPLIERNDRVHFLGWKNNKDITDILSGTDIYCQPGTQSATFQVSLCCGCVAMVYPYMSHKYLMEENCIYVTGKEDMVKVFEAILTDETLLVKMKEKSYIIAEEKLNYVKLARRICK